MTIGLSEDLQRFVREQVECGRYPSEEDVIRDALEKLREQSKRPHPRPGLGSIGAMRDAADELDEVVEHAMRLRREDAARSIPVE